MEADADGNDLATTYDLGQSPGLVSLAAAARRGSASAGAVDEHARRLTDGLAVIPGPVAAEEPAAAVGSIAGRLGGLAPPTDACGAVIWAAWAPGRRRCRSPSRRR